MRNLRNLLAFFTLAVLLATTACQQNTDNKIDITGTVTNNSMNLEGVAVTASSGETATTDANGQYSINADKEGTLTFSKATFVTKEMQIDGNATIDVTLDKDPFILSFAGNGNSVMDPQIPATSAVPSVALPATGPTGAWYTTAAYKGAVAPMTGTPWYDGWSFYSRLVSGTNTSDVINTGGLTVVTVTDADIQTQVQGGATTINWTNGNLYKLDGFVFIPDGVTLDIQEGTVIQGMAGTGADASALIIARGGKIMAQGTAAAPIIFTFDGDNGGTTADTRGRWGGLIVLGKAGLNSAQGETQIEGIPTTESRGLYGTGSTGGDDNDNSGTIEYVSIRHGGTLIGGDNEINGLTLGGVGSGTTIRYVEVIGNRDDGIEWFGGTAQAKYLISAFCGDDGIDYDEGYRGKNQFVIIHQDPAMADNGGEFDGGTTPQTGTPFAIPEFWNVTMIGNPNERVMALRDNAGGKFYNSIFTGFGRGVEIENLPDEEQDSYKQFQDGNLLIKDCIFYNIAAGTTAEQLFVVVDEI